MKSCYMTDVGQKRTTNQDFVYASETPVGNLPNLFVVADGMGGHKAGDMASRFTVETLLESIRGDKDQSPARIIQKAIDKANASVLEKSQTSEILKGMGTTVVVATIVGQYLYVANVGDSRLYLIDDHIQQVTRDHSLVEEMVRLGEIDRDQAKHHPDKNIITRAVGVNQNVKIDFFDVKLRKKDTILMCSDGLSNMLEDSEMESIVKQQKNLSDAAKRLVAKANENGGKDNIAVILVQPLVSEVEEC